mmetsp:Transcript_30036/g.76493  ORF Transcript_30036/g.76493 Transcript_30036/m.76493 type:complete len:207 (-) Transcript_30036:398-1018(-)
MVVGTKCPVIEGLTFLKGSPIVPGKDLGTVLVLELWATWCGPCVQSIPHLTEMQHKYKGKAVIIGCNTEGPHALDKVRRFVDSKGSAMDYTVAADTGGSIEQLMQAAGVRGIPHAFIVGADGTITHSGHPMDPAFDAQLQAACNAAVKPQVALPPITSSYEELMGLSVKELKAMLSERGIDMTGACEKGDLAKLVVEKASKVTYYR